MTFWTFLDRNSYGLFCLTALALICFADRGHDHKGCALHIGPTTATSASASAP